MIKGEFYYISFIFLSILLPKIKGLYNLCNHIHIYRMSYGNTLLARFATCRKNINVFF